MYNYNGAFLLDVYRWFEADDIRTLCVLAAVLFTCVSYVLYREVLRLQKVQIEGAKVVGALAGQCAELNKGKKMTRKERQRYLRTVIPDIITDAFETAYINNRLTKTEVNEHYRILAALYKMPDLKTRKLHNTEEVVQPTQAKKPAQSHFERVKAGIHRRLSNLGFRKLLYTPVNIPGPAVGAEVKSRPLKKKGALFGKVRTT